MTDISRSGGDDEPPPATVQSTHEFTDDQPPSETIVRAVAALTNTPVLELEPLYTVIDPTQIDETYEKTSAAVEAEFSFTYSGCDVTVTREGVHVRRVRDGNGNGDGANEDTDV
ncbi:HalOD1 output domain-containing protein [Natrialba sp. PRR66]|uniref:HalOD1 output domain-containing protein n=1 Tax=Natrialba sp. PRR66 TaxID=3098146 RepID=UPI002B1D1D6E|nr:HalOD1 output domain-containing protein [Natrialba sp. PRR66]